MEAWDVAFAGLYLAALDAVLSGGTAVPRPWRLACDAPASLPALRRVLLGINAHVNYDLPQALLAVITDEEFADPADLESRRRDHERIDVVLSGHVAAEDRQLSAVSRRSLLDRALRPLNRLGSGGSSVRPATRCGTTPSSCSAPAWPAPRRTPPGWPSWSSSVPRGSPISSRPGKSFCAWRSGGSVWSFPHPGDRDAEALEPPCSWQGHSLWPRAMTPVMPRS